MKNFYSRKTIIIGACTAAASSFLILTDTNLITNTPNDKLNNNQSLDRAINSKTTPDATNVDQKDGVIIFDNKTKINNP